MPAIQDQTAKFVRDLAFFRGMARGDVEALTRNASVRTYKDGDIIIRKGDAADRLFVILSGGVQLLGSGAAATLEYSRGEIFGEAAIFAAIPSPYTAEAAGETRVIEVPAPALERRTRDGGEILQRIIASMMRSLARLNAAADGEAPRAGAADAHAWLKGQPQRN